MNSEHDKIGQSLSKLVDGGFLGRLTLGDLHPDKRGERDMNKNINQPCVYRIQIGENHYYYGSTIHFPNRKSQHLSSLKKGDHCNHYIQNSYNKHQEFSMEIVDEVSEVGEIEDIERKVRELEQIYLDEHWGQPGCMNLSKSADGGRLGLKHTEATKKKMSAARKGVPKSAETRKKMSEFQRRIANSDEHRAKKSARMKGKRNGSKGGVIATNKYTGDVLTFLGGKEAGDYFGTSQVTVSKWCRGKAKPTKGPQKHYTFRYGDDT